MKRQDHRAVANAGLITLCLLLAACAQAPVAREPLVSADPPGVAAARPPAVVEPAVNTAVEPDVDPAADSPEIRRHLGNGEFLKRPAALPALPVAEGADVTLNFEDADLREVLETVLGDILELNYLIDPGINGRVTLRTARPLPRSAVLSTLETVLLQNGYALIIDRDLVKVLPVDSAAQAGLSVGVGERQPRDAAGFGIQIVPLRYISAREIEKVVQPFLPRGGAMQVDETRNLLILSGPRSYLGRALDTIDLFDVNWLEGMSFAMFPLQYSDATEIINDLEQILGKGSDKSAGAVRLLPIKRLNAVMVIARQAAMLDQAQHLIEDLDRGGESSPGRRLYVYHVKNGKAEHIAGLLTELFGKSDGKASSGGGQEQDPQRRSLSALRDNVTPTGTAPPTAAAATETVASIRNDTRRNAPATRTDNADGTGVGGLGEVSITADQDNNLVLVMASAQDYRVVEAAIQRLDIPARQVLIEARSSR